MKRVKGVVGALLIIGSIAGVFAWEFSLREAVLFCDTIVAKQEIRRGETIREENIELRKVPKDQRIQGAQGELEKNKLIGKKSKQLIPQNAQISTRYLDVEGLYPKGSESIYKINKEWIFMMSTSLRRGDEISIITKDDWENMGRFQVVFVKDSVGREVKTVEGVKDEMPFDRTDGTYLSDYVEIIADLESYQKIIAKAGEGKTFLLVQEGKEVTYEKK